MKAVLPIFLILFVYCVSCEDLEEVKRRGLLRAKQSYRYNHPPDAVSDQTIPVSIVYDKVIDRSSRREKVFSTLGPNNPIGEVEKGTSTSTTPSPTTTRITPKENIRYRYNHPPETENEQTIPVSIMYDKVIDKSNRKEKTLSTFGQYNRVNNENKQETIVVLDVNITTTTSTTPLPTTTKRKIIETDTIAKFTEDADTIPQQKIIKLEYKIPVTVIYDEETRGLKPREINKRIRSQQRKFNQTRTETTATVSSTEKINVEEPKLKPVNKTRRIQQKLVTRNQSRKRIETTTMVSSRDKINVEDPKAKPLENDTEILKTEPNHMDKNTELNKTIRSQQRKVTRNESRSRMENTTSLDKIYVEELRPKPVEKNTEILETTPILVKNNIEVVETMPKLEEKYTEKLAAPMPVQPVKLEVESKLNKDSEEKKMRLHGDPDPVVPIIASENRVLSHRGEFVYSYEGGDGTKAFSKGQLREVDEKEGEAVEGGFSYKDKEGNDFSLTYTADENGYRPVGAHLPTPPPIPPAIARALAYLATKTTPEPVTEAMDETEISYDKQT